MKQDKRSRQEADALVEAFERSGQTRVEFCAGAGIAPHSLDYYRRQRGRIGRRPGRLRRPEATPRLVEVEVSAAAATPLILVLSGGLRIEVHPGFDGGTLRELLAVAGGC